MLENVTAVNLLLDSTGLDFNLPDSFGNTPIGLAILVGDPRIVRALLRCGRDQVDVNVKSAIARLEWYALKLSQGDADTSFEVDEFAVITADIEKAKAISFPRVTKTFATRRMRSLEG